MFYIFHHEGKRLVFITDTGYVSDRMKGIISNADAYVFESNHDVSCFGWENILGILSAGF